MLGSRLNRERFAKVNVEGHEEQVIQRLQGRICWRTSLRVDPDAKRGEQSRGPDGAIGRFLTGLSYQMFDSIHKRMIGHSIEKLEHQDGCTCDNYLAVA